MKRMLMNFAFALFVVGALAASSNAQDRLDPGTTLRPEGLKSDRGSFRLVEGNLILADNEGKQRWTSKTTCDQYKYKYCLLRMQSDGNLVLTGTPHVSGATQADPLWSTNTGGNPGAYLAVDYFNYMVRIIKDGRVIWKSQ